MSEIFLYPKVDKIIGSPNPYISNFTRALSKRHHVVNKHAKNRGVFNLFLYLIKTDIFIFNWIEDLPEKRNGKFQVFLFVLFMGLAKVFKKRVVWVLHNKYSHHKEKDNWIDFMYRFMMKNSHLVITHSNSGVNFVKDKYPEFSSKVKMFLHPVLQIFPRTPSVEKKYDLLIWGSIFPYKGILQFLKFVKEHHTLSTMKILVVGRCKNEAYKRQLLDSMTTNVTFHDKVYGMDEISGFANQSRFTLFTYKSQSVISSGSLMDSISMGSKIIGPNHGAFRDLSKYSFIKIYDSFEDLVPIITHTYSNEIPDDQELMEFCKMNSWDSFVKKLEMALGQDY